MSPDALSIGEPNFLPNGWISAPLGQLGSWMGGGTPSKSVAEYWANGAIPWVSPKDMKAEIIQDTEDHITEAAVANSATKFVPAGSVLMVMRSGILRHTFPVAVNADRVTVNQDLRALIPAEGINPRYVAHYLHGIQRQVLDKCSKDGTTVQSIEASALERVRIPVAPTAEQGRIVARIDELFAEIAEGEAALERAREGLDTWRRALLKVAVTGELTRDWREANRPTETGSRSVDILGPYAIPTGWIWTTVGAAGQVLLGRQRAPQHHSGPNMRPYLRVANVLEDRIDFSDVKFMNFTPSEFQRYHLQPGDILLNEGQSLDLVGRPAIYRGEVEECCFQKTLLRFRAAPETLFPEYAQIVFLHYLHSKRFRRAAPITTNMAHLTLERLLPIEFPLPPREEQTVIVNRYHGMRDMIDDLTPALEDRDRNALRQAILKAAFEGRLAPQDPADEPASALLARLRDGHRGNGVRQRRARAAANFLHPSLPGLTWQPVDPRVEPAGDE